MSNEIKKVTRKLRAILSADVKGYSLLMEDDEVHTIQTLKACRQIMSDLIQGHSGRVVDNPGDNLLAEFESALDAVDCAVQIQSRLKKENEKFVVDKRLEFRIGVNIGDVIQDGGRIYGNGVNVAARIEGLAEPGGVCISRNAYDHVKNKLPVGYEYIGEHSVKNIKDPVRVYKLLMADEDAGKLIGDVPKFVVKNWIWATIVVAVAVITVVLVLAYQKVAEPDIKPAKVEAMVYPLPDKPSIAVLPFRNMSGDPSKDYIADSLTENIITNLAKLPEVFVISRETSFYYKGKNIQISTVSEELGVQYVLEGSIIVEGNNFRATAQLIDAISGHHVWAQNYDRDLEGLLTLLDDITLSILKEMHVEIKVGYKDLGAGTENINAYLKVVEGRYLILLNIKEENLKARGLIQEAIELDPNYAYAYTYLGLTYLNEANWSWSENPRKSIRMAIELLQKSIAMNDKNWANHSLIAYCYYRQDPNRARIESEKALALAPGEGLAYIFHAKFLRHAGEENDEVITEIAEKGRRLSPYLNASARFWLCGTYFNNGNYDEVITLAKSLLRENFLPDRAYAFMILSHLEKGETEKAIFYAKKLMEVNSDFQVLGLLNWEAIKLSADADDLIEPIKHVLYPEGESFKTFSYDRKPKFKFTFPSSYKEFKKHHPDMILSLQTPKFESCSVVITRLTQDQTLDNFWETYLIHVMNNFGSEFQVKMNKIMTLDCGTEAHLLEVDWRFYNGRYLKSRFVYAFHSGYGVAVQIMSPIDEDGDLSWVDHSLTFYEEEPPPTLHDKPSIAVLPFDNLSDDPEQGYLADGLTDELICDLAKIKDVLVISRNSTFTYKRKDIKIPDVAKELNVRYVLEGSVQRSGNKIRIRAQLIDGKTDHHVWAESYDGVMDDIFDLQDKISNEIVSALKVKLDTGGIEQSREKETHDIRAYEYFLKGWNHYLLTTKNDFLKAIELYHKALELDPEYKRVYAALALVYWEGVIVHSTGDWLDSLDDHSGVVNKNLVLAQKYLNRSLKDPTPITYTVSSRILLDKRKYKEAISQAQKGISLNHSNLSARFSLVDALIFSGQPEQALSQIEEILWLDPINPARAYIALSLAYYCMDNLQKAYEYIEKAKNHNPMIGCDIRAVIYANKGMKDEALTAAVACQPPFWDNIRWRMMSFQFNDKVLAQKVADGLYSAGVPGKASGYYKIFDEYKLNGDEIRNLLFDKKIQTHSYRGDEMFLSFLDNNVCTYTGPKPTEKGAYWIEKDSIWLDMPLLFYGEKCQAEVYRYPDENEEVFGSYFLESSFNVFPFSILE